MNIKSQATRGTRGNRTLAIHPATRAIRHALALGLAVVASQPALAGQCDANAKATAVHERACIGDLRAAQLPLAVHEWDGNNAYSINNVFFGATSTEGTSALVQGGLEVRLGNNLTIGGSLSWQDGGALQSFFGGRVGMRVNG